MSERYISLARHHPTNREEWWESARNVIARALVNNVEQVETNERTLSGGGGVYVGLSGLTLMESRIAALLGAGLNVPELSVQRLEELADWHISRAVRAANAFRIRTTHVSFLETGIGIATLAILRYRVTDANSSNESSWRTYTQVLNRAIRNIVHEDNNDDPSTANDDGCEVLYGRAGLLYSLLLLRNALDRGGLSQQPPEFAGQLNRLVAVDNLRLVVDSIIVRGRRGSEWVREDIRPVSKTELTLPALMWSWHQKRYLGAAHGVVGILQMVLSCPVEVVAPYMDDILNTVEWLISTQDESGNWPSSFKLHKPHSINELIQWCHGAPGALILLSTILKLAQRPNSRLPIDDQMKARIASSLHRGASLVYRHGFLRKGLGICHGVAGTVYALLAVADVSNEIQSRLSGWGETTQSLDYLSAAVHLCVLATRVDELVEERKMRVPDRPWSLYEGRAGMCCAWAEVLCRMEVEMSGEGVLDRRKMWGMPGYSDLQI